VGVQVPLSAPYTRFKIHDLKSKVSSSLIMIEADLKSTESKEFDGIYCLILFYLILLKRSNVGVVSVIVGVNCQVLEFIPY
jgi:hypothetical protein